MSLFRSEEHIQRWLGTRDPGAIIPVVMLNELAHAWLTDELAPDWRPRSHEQDQAILDKLELTGEFWRLS